MGAVSCSILIQLYSNLFSCAVARQKLVKYEVFTYCPIAERSSLENHTLGWYNTSQAMTLQGFLQYRTFYSKRCISIALIIIYSYTMAHGRKHRVYCI